VMLNSHHATPFCMGGGPMNLEAAVLARITEKLKIVLLGNVLPIWDDPMWLVEELAVIDMLSRGRLVSGWVRGTGRESIAHNAQPPFNWERFQEAHDFIIKAWTTPGPFRWEGQHYQYRYVNPWMRPYQKPHPQIWVPSQGSFETLAWTAHPDRKYTYLQTYSPFRSVVRFMSGYRAKAREYGYEASPDQLGWLVPIYVADTDQKAIDEARPHIEAFANKFLHIPSEMLLPPGYTSIASLQNMRKHKGNLAVHHTIESLIADEFVMIGSPDTVRRKLLNCQRTVAFGNVLALLQFGTLPADLTRRNMDRFAQDILPALQQSHVEQPELVAAE